MSDVKRRSSLQSTAAAGAGLALLGPRSAPAQSAANDEIGLGLIGDRGESRVGQLAEGDGELRRLLDDPAVDAVVIATCNHWHCLAAIRAMQAGKDVHVEKPLSHTQWEGRQVVAAARKYDRVCQLGTQQRSDPMQTEIKRFLHEEQAPGEPSAGRGPATWCSARAATTSAVAAAVGRSIATAKRSVTSKAAR